MRGIKTQSAATEFNHNGRFDYSVQANTMATITSMLIILSTLFFEIASSYFDPLGRDLATFMTVCQDQRNTHTRADF
jgi:hypothetical protein